MIITHTSNVLGKVTTTEVKYTPSDFANFGKEI